MVGDGEVERIRMRKKMARWTRASDPEDCVGRRCYRNSDVHYL